MTTPNDPAPQAGDLNAQLIAMYPGDYLQALSAQGVTDEYAEDYQKSLAAAAVLRIHASELFQMAHGQANAQAGLGVDPEAVPVEWAQKLGAVHPRDLLDFAQENYDGPRGHDPVKALNADLAKFKKQQADTDFGERYGNPNEDSDRRR